MHTTRLRRLHLTTLILAAAAAAACATVDERNHLSAPARLAPEGAEVWSRPSEYGFEMLQDVEGKAVVFKLLGLSVVGEDVDTKLPIIGSLLNDDEDEIHPLVRVAAANAIDSVKGADGLYIVRSSVRETGPWPIFYQLAAEVRGKALRVKDLGTVDATRADRARLVRSLPKGLKQAEGLLQHLFGR